jgi:hypothetical protein
MNRRGFIGKAVAGLAAVPLLGRLVNSRQGSSRDFSLECWIHPPENPKVFWSADLNKWVMLPPQGEVQIADKLNQEFTTENVVVYDRLLSEKEIRERYNAYLKETRG